VLRKYIFPIILAALFMLIFCGWKEGESESVGVQKYITIYVDEKTGVEYIVYDGKYGCGICPRYNADETLMTHGKK